MESETFTILTDIVCLAGAMHAVSMGHIVMYEKGKFGSAVAWWLFAGLFIGVYV